jgi:hypothetical protein
MRDLLDLHCQDGVLSDPISMVLSRVLVTSDAGLDRWVDLVHINQAELQLIITLWILL